VVVAGLARDGHGVQRGCHGGTAAHPCAWGTLMRPHARGQPQVHAHASRVSSVSRGSQAAPARPHSSQSAHLAVLRRPPTPIQISGRNIAVRRPPPHARLELRECMCTEASISRGGCQGALSSATEARRATPSCTCSQPAGAAPRSPPAASPCAPGGPASPRSATKSSLSRMCAHTDRPRPPLGSGTSPWLCPDTGLASETNFASFNTSQHFHLFSRQASSRLLFSLLSSPRGDELVCGVPAGVRTHTGVPTAGSPLEPAGGIAATVSAAVC
jgi:hypothetical protein